MRYQCTCPEYEDRPCDNPNEELECQDCPALGSNCKCFPWCEHLKEDGLEEDDAGYCPRCSKDYEIGYHTPKYCENCGQALDWGGYRCLTKLKGSKSARLENGRRGVIRLSRKLPEDYAIDALSLEADRRGKLLGRPYSYGQLVADTTLVQRQEIAEAYRTGASRKKNERAVRYIPVSDREDIERILEKVTEDSEEAEKAGE